jgi:uncharacterized protein YegL
MKKNLCELVVIIDESGSMQNVTNDTIGGFNTFLETHQKLPGEANLTLVKFNTKYEIVYNGVDVRSVKPLDRMTYMTGGMTALLDATGRAIDEVGKRYDAMNKKDRPGKVIFLIITDGEENSSKEYKLEQIKNKVQLRQNDNKWEFVFMGANQDAWKAAGTMGVNNAVNYSVHDTARSMKAAAYYTANSRMFSKATDLDNFDMSDAELTKEIDNLTDDKKDKKYKKKTQKL